MERSFTGQTKSSSPAAPSSTSYDVTNTPTPNGTTTFKPDLKDASRDDNNLWWLLILPLIVAMLLILTATVVLKKNK
jgi:hypothetical protein